MISVSSEMILSSVCASMILGALFGMLNSFTAIFAKLLKHSILNRFFKISAKSKTVVALANAYDFIFVLTVCTFYLLSTYFFTDGIFYIHSFVSFFISFLLVSKIFGAIERISTANKEK